MECMKCYYESMILEQQISYAMLECDYRNLRGNEVVIESELSSKVSEKFKSILSTISRWITNILNFITKTIPTFIKSVIQKINDKIHKREKNKKVVDAAALPSVQQDKVKSIAASINSNNKLGRKLENQIDTSEIKKELDNATKTDSSSNNTADKSKEENIKKATETYNENKKKIEEEINKVEDSSIKAELTEANNKKEEVVVKTEKEPKLVGYKGMYIPDKAKNRLYDSISFSTNIFNSIVYTSMEAIGKYGQLGDDRKSVIKSYIYKNTEDSDHSILNLNKILDNMKDDMRKITLEEVIKSKLPKSDYEEVILSSIKNAEKNILKFKKSIDTLSKKQKITNEESLLFTKYFNMAMPATNRYIREMTNTLSYLIKITVSFCDNAVAVYE